VASKRLGKARLKKNHTAQPLSQRDWNSLPNSNKGNETRLDRLLRGVMVGGTTTIPKKRNIPIPLLLQIENATGERGGLVPQRAILTGGKD